MKTPARKNIASNRRAHHNYAILDTYEAGIVLTGSEVKSLREGHATMAEAYGRFLDRDLWLESLHIPPYQFAVGVGAHDPDRPRKLLMHRAELDKLRARMHQDRLTLVPLTMYFKDGRVKVELGLGQGRKKSDKRQALAERDSQREIQREMGRNRKALGTH
jgi:SsrA-binding protein